MYTLSLRNGDLSVGSGGILDTVSGTAMLSQELGSWIMEPLGSDPFHTTYGSSIHETIGSGIDNYTASSIERAVSDTVQAYLEYQGSRIRSEMLSGRNPYKPSDIVTSVDGIDVSVDRDTVTVKVSVSTASGDKTTIVREI